MNVKLIVEIDGRSVEVSVPRDKVQETIANLVANTQASWVSVVSRIA